MSSIIKAREELDVALSTRASNAVLLQVKAGTDNIPAVSQAIMDESMPVVIASDQSPIPVTNTNLDVLLSTRASEATLIQVRDYLDTVETKLQTIIDDIVLQNDWATTQATTTVAASVTSVLLIAANASRRQVTIRNTSSKNLYICMFTPATTATPFVLAKDDVWVFPKWRGLIYGIWDTGATGNAYITEEKA